MSTLVIDSTAGILPRINALFEEHGLPGMNGVKLVKLIRSKTLWRKTPVLMLTGSKDANDVKDSLAAGANDYIVKPVQIADFSKRLEKFLGPAK